MRLQGHEGSIFRLRWSPAQSSLASVSDDRTLRLWRLPDPRPSSASPTAPMTITQSQQVSTGGCCGQPPFDVSRAPE